MPNGVRRLNRRRYRESVAALKEIIGDKKTPALRKLRAIDTLLGIYDRHDRTEASKEARRKAGDAPDGDDQPEASPETQETPEQVTARILERYRTKGETFEQQ
jgi:hypothetical protein